MRRRTLLRLGAVGVVGSAVVSAHRPNGYAPLGAVELPGAKELVVQGSTAYVAVTDGFAVVDLADPTDPRIVTERRNILSNRTGGPLRGIWDVAVSDNILVAVGPANPGQGLYGAAIYDIADPSTPTLRGFHRTRTYIHNCEISSGYLYLTGNAFADKRLLVLELVDDGARVVGTWSPLDAVSAWGEVPGQLRRFHDLTVRSGIAYCAYWDAGTWLLDVTDPTTPTLISRFGDHDLDDLRGLSGRDARVENIESPGNAHVTALNEPGTVLGVGRESWDSPDDDDSIGPAGIDLIDVTDRGSLELLSTIEATPVNDATQSTGVWTTAHNFELRATRLYSSWYQDGVKLYDLTDPTDPELLAHWRKPKTHRFWTAQAVDPGDYFVASSMGTYEAEASIVTFPDAAGTQSDQPPLEPEPPSPTASPTATETDVTTTLATKTRSETPVTDTQSTAVSTELQTPGFGPILPISSLAVGWWVLRRGDSDD